MSFIVFMLLAGVCFAQKGKDLPADLEHKAQEYFAKDDYDGFYQYLQTFLKEGASQSPNVYFYLASARQQQILYWQKTKNWEGVYDKATGYRKDIDQNLSKAESLAKDNPELLLGIKYLKWQNVEDEDPDRGVGLFNDVANTARDMVKSGPSIEKIKQIADELSTLEDKNLSRRLYEVYVEKLNASNLSKKEIKERGEKFLEEGHAYLAKAVFDNYLNRLSDNKELQAKETVAIANKFVDNGREEGLDPMYAETMYKKAYELIGQAAFDSQSQYRRAFNLERLKEFERAIDEYKNLIHAYPDYAQKSEIYFRLGVLAAYAQKNIDQAQEYFLKLKDEFALDLLVLSSLYQLGLLSQWKKDFDKAKEFYDSLMENAKARGVDLEKNEIVLLVKDRLKEIEDKKEIKYALRLFLEGTFRVGKENVPSPVSIDLTARPAKADVGQSVRFVVTTSYPQTGCMTPQYSYEWSGELGSISNIPNSPELTTDYASPGIKVIHVALVGPQGPEGVAFEMAQISESEVK